MRSLLICLFLLKGSCDHKTIPKIPLIDSSISFSMPPFPYIFSTGRGGESRQPRQERVKVVGRGLNTKPVFLLLAMESGVWWLQGHREPAPRVTYPKLNPQAPPATSSLSAHVSPPPHAPAPRSCEEPRSVCRRAGFITKSAESGHKGPAAFRSPPGSRSPTPRARAPRAGWAVGTVREEGGPRPSFLPPGGGGHTRAISSHQGFDERLLLRLDSSQAPTSQGRPSFLRLISVIKLPLPFPSMSSSGLLDSRREKKKKIYKAKKTWRTGTSSNDK